LSQDTRQVADRTGNIGAHLGSAGILCGTIAVDPAIADDRVIVPAPAEPHCPAEVGNAWQWSADLA
jgi:hypothetical protein